MHLLMKAQHLTLTILSQPQETMMGLLLLGEKRTQETHSEWPSSCKLNTMQVTLHYKLF